MVCSNCVREIPDGSAVCPRCGSAQAAGERTAESHDENPIQHLLGGGSWVASAPAAEPPIARGWEQTGRFESVYHKQEGKVLPAYTLFSGRGKLNRLKYFYLLCVSNLAYSIAYIGLMLALVSESSLKVALSLACAPILLLTLIVTMISGVKRFHDIDEPGVNTLFLFVPFYNIYVALKLLFKGSVLGYNNYGETASNHWYWQTPLTILLLPIVYFMVCFGVAGNAGLMATLGRDTFKQYYYSEQYHVGITFPKGWIRSDMDGSIASAQTWTGTEAIMLCVEASDAPSFDTLSQQQLEQAAKNMADDETLAAYLQNAGNKFTDISNSNGSIKDINGKTFIQVGFTARLNRTDVRGIMIMGAYEGNTIVVAMCLPASSPGNNLDAIMESADSLVIDTAKDKEAD